MARIARQDILKRFRAMIRRVEGGSACVIFPEGRITTTGSLMKVYEGPAVIAERTRAALVLIRIEGVEYSPFSRLSGKVRRRLFPKIALHILPARRLETPPGVVGRARRAALRRALGDEMVRSTFETARIASTARGGARFAGSRGAAAAVSPAST